MLLRLVLFSSIIFSTFLFQSCKKDTSIKYPLSDQYFPFKTGNTWTYNVEDTSDLFIGPRIRNYDVQVSMEGVKTLSDGKDAYIMKFQYPEYVDTQFVRFANDTLKIFSNYLNENFTVPKDIFIIPFSDHQYYSSNVIHGFQYDVSYLNSYGNYGEVYRIGRSAGEGLSLKKPYYIYKPNLGFVEFTNHVSYADYIVDQLWKLKSYKLK